MNTQIELSIATFKALGYRAERTEVAPVPLWHIVPSRENAPIPAPLHYGETEIDAWKELLRQMPRFGPMWDRGMAVMLLESLHVAWLLEYDVNCSIEHRDGCGYSVTIDGKVYAELQPTACEAICRAFVRYKGALADKS